MLSLLGFGGLCEGKVFELGDLSLEPGNKPMVFDFVIAQFGVSLVRGQTHGRL